MGGKSANTSVSDQFGLKSIVPRILGQYLFQSDADLDIVDSLNEQAGLELHMLQSEKDQTKARNAFNEGKFNELFDIVRGEKKKKSLILLTAVAMQMGANVKKNRRNLIEQIYKKAHLMEGAENMRTNGSEEGFTGPSIIMGGGKSQKPNESAKSAEKEGPPKTCAERAKEKLEKVLRDPRNQRYVASVLNK